MELGSTFSHINRLTHLGQPSCLSVYNFIFKKGFVVFLFVAFLIIFIIFIFNNYGIVTSFPLSLSSLPLLPYTSQTHVLFY